MRFVLFLHSGQVPSAVNDESCMILKSQTLHLDRPLSTRTSQSEPILPRSALSCVMHFFGHASTHSLQPGHLPRGQEIEPRLLSSRYLNAPVGHSLLHISQRSQSAGFTEIFKIG